jgi:hypothetical protein
LSEDSALQEKLIDFARKLFLQNSFCEFDRDAYGGFYFFLNDGDIRSLCGSKIRVRFNLRVTSGVRRKVFKSEFKSLLELDNFNFTESFVAKFIEAGALEPVIEGINSSLDTECDFDGTDIEFVLEKSYADLDDLNTLPQHMVNYTNDILRVAAVLRKMDEFEE